MDATSLIFLVLMVLLTGGMAFGGDWLGRYLGKRRITLGKIRPKHTAGIITALAGSLGALLVVMFLMGVSEPVRVWILSGNQARAELEKTRKELEAIKGQTATLEKRLEGAQKNLTKASDLASQAEKKNSELSKENTSLLSNSERVQAEIKNRTAEVEKLTKNAATERVKLVAVRSEYEKEKLGADRIRKDNSAIQSRNLQLTQANGDLEKQTSMLEKQKASLEKTATQLEAQTKDLSISLETLKKTFDATSREQRELLQASQSQLQDSTEELEKTTSLLASIRIDLDTIERERLALLSLSEASRNQPMVVEKMDELVRTPIAAGLTLAESRSFLLAAMKKAGVTAINRGSGVTAVTREAVLFLEVQRPNQPSVTGPMQFEALVKEVAGATEPRVMILRALVNTFAGEPVPLDAVIYRNPVVYQQGDVVAETRIDGRLEQEEIIARLEDFVQTLVRQKVMNAGIIPAKGTAQPLGELSRDTVLRIVQGVKASGVNVKVQFVAAELTRAGDSLRLDYRIR